MLSVFDQNKLRELLKDFYHLTHIRTSVFDVEGRELLSWPEQRPDFCALIRTSPAGCAACAASDEAACGVALTGSKTYVYRCHAGLTEAVMPLYVGRVPVGFLLFGHVFSYENHEEGWQVIREKCQKYAVDMEALRAACLGMPILSAEFIQSAAHILQATASYLILERMAVLKEDSLAYRLDNWLMRKYKEKITVEDACRELKIGRTRLFKLCGQLYGRGFAQQVRAIRIEKARTLLLEHPDRTITEIAEECGFGDYNYFIAVFSKEEGLSPNAYRKQNAAPPPESI